MDIQRYTTNLSLPRSTVSAEVGSQKILQPVQFDKPVTHRTVPLESLRTVYSPQLKSTLLALSKASNSSSVDTFNNDNKLSRLQNYNSISEFEQLQQLSSVIGIDVHV